MRNILRLRPYIGPHRNQFILAFVSVVASAICVMASPLMVLYAIEFGLDPQRDADGTVVGLDGNQWLLVWGAAGVVLFALGRGIAMFGQQFLGEAIGQRIAYSVRNEIYGNLQRLSYSYHDRMHTGQVMSRVTQDVESIRMFIAMGGVRFLYVILVLFLAMGGMFWISWELALVSVVTLPFMAYASFRMAKQVRPLWLEIQQNQGELTQVAEEGLSGIRVVKAFSREDFESARFAAMSKRQADLSLRSSQIMARFQPFLMGLGLLQIALTVGFGSYLITQNLIAESSVITFTLWLGLLQLPIRTVGFAVTFIARAASACERIFELIDAQSAVQEKLNAPELDAPHGHVRFEGVAFSYDNLSAVLSGIDIDAKPGSVIALLGPTGSGKSTVVNLLPRFYDVTAGRITIDGTDIRDVTLESLRRSIGIVQQDVFLFIGTIRDNIAYGRPDATEDDVVRAAKAARIHDFIVSLPDGYDEWVGERGVTLSGGQKQRIAIARTLLLDPRILIFDDSTSSVDPRTEMLIQQALHELMDGRTTFVIAQRLRTIMRADEILVLDGGQIVQRGRHEELLAQEGLYRQIYDLELKDQEEALGRTVALPPPVAANGNGHEKVGHEAAHTPAAAATSGGAS